MSIRDLGKKSAAFGPSPLKVSSGSSSSKKSAKSVVGRGSASFTRSENATPGNGFGGLNPEAHKQILAKIFPSADGGKPLGRESKARGGRSCTGLRPKLASKASRVLCQDASQNGQSYPRSSTGSCHDACKFGGHWHFEGSGASKSGGKGSSSNDSRKAVSKASTKVSSKISKIGTAVKSPVRSRNSQALRTPAAKISVNCRIQSDAKPVKSSSRPSPEGKYKVARALFRSPVRAPEGPDHRRGKNNLLPMQKVFSGIKCRASMSGRPVQSSESPNGALISTPFAVQGRGLSDINCRVCDDHSEDEFSRDYSAYPCYSPPGYPVHGACNKTDAEYREIPQFGSHPELDNPFDINGDQRNSEHSGTPRSGVFADEANDNIAEKGENHRLLVSEDKNAAAPVPHKRKFRGTPRQGSGGVVNPEPKSVVLRHQDMHGRKPSEEWMIDHVIGEAVNKLSHYEESKVKVLVGAFETVISLTDQSEATELKQIDPPARPLQACN